MELYKKNGLRDFNNEKFMELMLKIAKEAIAQSDALLDIYQTVRKDKWPTATE